MNCQIERYVPMVCNIVPSPHRTITAINQCQWYVPSCHLPGVFPSPLFLFFHEFSHTGALQIQTDIENHPWKLIAWGIWTFLVFYAFSEFNQVCVWVWAVNIVSDIQMTFSPQQKMAGATLTPRHPLLHVPSRDKSRVTFEKMPLLKTFYNPEHSYKCT